MESLLWWTLEWILADLTPAASTAAGSASMPFAQWLDAAQQASPSAPATPAAGSGSEKSTLQPDFAAAAAVTGLSPLLLEAVAKVESDFNPAAESAAGAIGVMQLMPATAAELGVDPYNPAANILGGARYLAELLNHFHGNLELALAAYNAGPAAVAHYGGIPPYPETEAYVRRVLDAFRRLQSPSSDA
ncbi:MAG: lytic transglycosylase domain-containing protein [Firmicutes bacterium]|nr:lytic transglycosylase domain-containing protein [Alicyclobacillaceae bacterium]MCL6497313.1 lytic transglycosylase domain-containing protein [Bacillota bacterium]